MIIVNGVRYRVEDAPKPLPDTEVAVKSEKPSNKARKPGNKAVKPANK